MNTAIDSLEDTMSAGQDYIAEVRDLTKFYGEDIHALDSINLGFPRGQMTTLLGPSGCGKTTLLKIIAGLLDKTSGQVLIDGKEVTGPGPERAFVFQDFALLPWATVLRNVAFGLELRGVAKSEREAIAEKYIDEVGLKGGDWGWIKRPDIRKELSVVAFDLEPGQYSRPVELGDTIFILYCEDKRKEMIQPVTEVRDAIENVLAGEIARESQERWIRDLRENGYVRYFL